MDGERDGRGEVRCRQLPLPRRFSCLADWLPTCIRRRVPPDAGLLASSSFSKTFFLSSRPHLNPSCIHHLIVSLCANVPYHMISSRPFLSANTTPSHALPACSSPTRGIPAASLMHGSTMEHRFLSIATLSDDDRFGSCSELHAVHRHLSCSCDPNHHPSMSVSPLLGSRGC